MNNHQTQYHSEPKITKFILKGRTLKRGNPYTHLTRAQIARGALQEASNNEREAFFAHSWVLLGNIGGFWLFAGLIMTMIGVMIRPANFSIGMIIACTVLYIISGAISGVSFSFYYKIAKCTDHKTLEPVVFTRREMLRPSLIGGTSGIALMIFIMGIIAFCLKYPR